MTSGRNWRATSGGGILGRRKDERRYWRKREAMGKVRPDSQLLALGTEESVEGLPEGVPGEGFGEFGGLEWSEGMVKPPTEPTTV